MWIWRMIAVLVVVLLVVVINKVCKKYSCVHDPPVK
jgi:hypothetical protein